MNNNQAGNFSYFSIPSNNILPQNNVSLQQICTLKLFPNSASNIQNLLNQPPNNPEPDNDPDSLGERIGTQPTISSSKKKKSGCTCKKTFCLKMYCECFSSGKYCSDNCNCINCRNTQQYKDIKQSKYSAKERQGGLKNCSLSEKRCNCKKSHCLKRYCECYNSGVSCSEACKCLNCENSEKQLPKEEDSEPEQEPQKKELFELNPEYQSKKQLPEFGYKSIYNSIDDFQRYYD